MRLRSASGLFAAAACALACAASGAPAAHRPVGRVSVVPYVELASGKPVDGAAAGYTPGQIRVAYSLNRVYRAGIEGQGETIGIVDVFGSPTVRADLSAFDHRYHLPKPPRFTIVRPSGFVPAFRAGDAEMEGWARETTLDVEWAHAIAPRARIVLAETGADEVEGTSGLQAIVHAEEFMINREHVSVLSQSFGATEETFPSTLSIEALRGAFALAERRRVTVIAASGDAGASGLQPNGTTYYDERVVSWPASDPLVTAVGGTTLFLAASGRADAPPTAWNDGGETPLATGGGVSSVFGRPGWQRDVATVVGAHRGVPDLALTASCDRPVELYASFAGGDPDETVCGTSVAAPIFAGIVALADQLASRRLGLLNEEIYRLGAAGVPGLVPVAKGDNSVRFVTDHHLDLVAGYTSRPGYNLATGWGTIDAALFVPELAGRPLPS